MNSRRRSVFTVLIFFVCSFSFAGTGVYETGRVHAYLPSVGSEEASDQVQDLEDQLKRFEDFWQGRAPAPFVGLPRLLILENKRLPIRDFYRFTADLENPEFVFRDLLVRLDARVQSSAVLRNAFHELHRISWFFNHYGALDSAQIFALPDQEIAGEASKIRGRIEEEWLPQILADAPLESAGDPTFLDHGVVYYFQLNAIVVPPDYLGAMTDPSVLLHEAAHALLAKVAPQFFVSSELYRSLNEVLADYLSAAFLFTGEPAAEIGGRFGFWLRRHGKKSDLPRRLITQGRYDDIAHDDPWGGRSYANGNVLRRFLWQLRLAAPGIEATIDQAVLRVAREIRLEDLNTSEIAWADGAVQKEIMRRFAAAILDALAERSETSSLSSVGREIFTSLGIPAVVPSPCERPLL